MSKRVSQLLLALATLSAGHAVLASGTYLTVVPGTSELRSLVSAKTLGETAEDAKTSEFAVRLVYSRTWDSANLGRYFTGVNDANNEATLSASPTAATDVNQGMILRKADMSSSPAAGNGTASKVTFLPKSTRFGLNLAYSQDLQSVMEGAWFDLNVSLARVKNDLNATISAGTIGNQAGTIDQFFAGQQGIAAATETGGVVPAGLAAGKISATNAAVTGLEQAALHLGYNFVNNDNAKFGVFVSGVAGLGTQPKLEQLFESVVGHRNLGLGLGVLGTVSLSKNDDYEMQLNVNAAGHYLFSRQDTRLGQITGQTGSAANWTHYYLAKDTVGTTWAPAANYLKQTVNVAPRYNADLGAQFVYSGDCVDFDLGYNMHYRATEQNTIVTSIKDAQYVIVGTDNTLVDGTAGALAIKNANINWSEDSQILHTVHGGVVYNCKDMENPVQLGLGGSASIGNDRARSEGHWSVFAKLGVAF